MRVDGLDYTRLDERVDELTIFVGNRCYMRLFEGHCAALVIDLASRRYVCSVYENRPAVCRDLRRSSPECEAEVHEKGERPEQLLQLLLVRPALK